MSSLSARGGHRLVCGMAKPVLGCLVNTVWGAGGEAPSRIVGAREGALGTGREGAMLGREGVGPGGAAPPVLSMWRPLSPASRLLTP